MLCLADSRLALALRRSLRCSRTKALEPVKLTSNARRQVPQPNTSLASAGARLAHYSHQGPRWRHSTADMVLGPSASYPDFMFACRAATTGPLDYGRLRGGPLQAAANASRHSLTGPPYPLASRHEQPLAIDTTQQPFRANFALMSKNQLGLRCATAGDRQTLAAGVQMVDTNCVARADLLASRRTRYSELEPAKRKRRSSAILSVTRRLLRLSRPAGLKARASRRASSGYLVSSSSTTDNNTSSSRGAGFRPSKRLGVRDSSKAGRMSPTSSLSTLIRKFNHDNYTSVCQQYEQQKQQIVGEERLLPELELRPKKQQQQVCGGKQEPALGSKKQELLIDGLDGPAKCQPLGEQSAGNRAASLLDEEQIFCRKGGLYYNYCLDQERAGQQLAHVHLQGQTKAPSNQRQQQATRRDSQVEFPLVMDLKSRVNPMLGGSSKQVRPEEQEEAALACGQQDSKANETLVEVFRECSIDGFRAAGAHAMKSAASPSLLAANRARAADERAELGRAGCGAAAAAGSVGSEQGSGKLMRGSLPNVQSSKRSPKSGGLGGKTKKKRGSGESAPAAGQVRNNNEAIISNISSVQELLNKMNGIMAKQTLEPSEVGGPKQVGADEGGRAGLQLKDGRSGGGGGGGNSNNNKAVSKIVAAKNNNNLGGDGRDKCVASRQLRAEEASGQSDTCANQLRQLTALAASSSAGAQYNPYDSLNRNATLDRSALDYASLRSMDDALSLVSVSSEFEYHNINYGHQQQQPPPSQRHTQAQAQTQSQSKASANQAGNDNPGRGAGKQERQDGSPTAAGLMSKQVQVAGAANPSGDANKSCEQSAALVALKSDTERCSALHDGQQQACSKRMAENRADSFGSVEARRSSSAGADQIAVGQPFASNRDPSGGGPTQQHSTRANSSQNSSSSVSIETGKRLDDLRFPSFLPTKDLPSDEAAAGRQWSSGGARAGRAGSKGPELGVSPPKPLLGSQKGRPRLTPDVLQRTGNHSNERSPKQAQQLAQSGKASSSLLNLTTAKFAAANAALQQNHHHQQLQHHRADGRSAAQRLSGANSSNTITKHKATAAVQEAKFNAEGNRIVTLAEFGARNPQTGSGRCDGTNERSLPAESGNVRARIRKMEQQSTPNLNTTSQQQAQVAGGPQRGRQQANSMIPVTSGSKLPVLASKVNQKTRNQQQLLLSAHRHKDSGAIR